MPEIRGDRAEYQTASSHDLDVSVVVPVHNEADNIAPLYQSITASMENSGWRYEVVFVDDGSTDDTLPELLAIHRRAPEVRVVQFRRNFGQTPAMCAGIQHAQGRIIVTMDGDLQNDPRDIPLLLSKVTEGYDLVTGWRRDRQDPLLSRTLPSRIANWLIAKVTGVPVHDNGCSLKAYRAQLIKNVPLYSEMHRFIPAMSTTLGASIAEVVVRHHPRRRGRSKYGLSRIGKVMLDMIAIKMLISFGLQPMRWFCTIAIPFLLVATLTLLIFVAAWGLGWTESPGVVVPLVTLLTVYLSGHLAVIGLLAELVLRARRIQNVRPMRSVEYINR